MLPNRWALCQIPNWHSIYSGPGIVMHNSSDLDTSYLSQDLKLAHWQETCLHSAVLNVLSSACSCPAHVCVVTGQLL